MPVTDDFINVSGAIVNKARLLAVQHKPEVREGVFYSREHYKAIFDTGQELRLTVEAGQNLSKQMLGSITTTSEIAT